MNDNWRPPDLRNRVAVVTGARRGIGRGVALVLGSCGATVYVTGKPHTDPPPDGCTLGDTAAMVTSRGGHGMAIECDHDDERQVEELFARIKMEQGGLDVLVNNVVHWALDSPVTQPPWQQPLSWWDDNMRTIRAHYLAVRSAVPLMLGRVGGLIVSTTEGAGHPDLPLRMRAEGTAVMVRGLAHWLTPRGITVAAVIPGFPRTEVIIAAFERRVGPFKGWTEERFLQETQSTEYTGRAVAAIAAAKDAATRSGAAWKVGELARAYGFTDIDGSQPE